jgi:hypothetical protein
MNTELFNVYDAKKDPHAPFFKKIDPPSPQVELYGYGEFDERKDVE